MKISYNWLKDFIDIPVSPQELSAILTDCGLEVEEFIHWQSVKGGLEGVVIAKVLNVAKHPNADKLSVTQVDTGSGQPIQIVCGAPNVAVGQKVLVATVGTTLYNGDEPWQIKNAKIRGEESFGMICAEDELGLGTSHAGIMVLPDDAPVGKLAAQYFSVIDDWVYTIGLTPNRIDAASHIGVARDVVAALNATGKHNLSLRTPEVKELPASPDALPVKILIEDTDACPRYSGITLNNITIESSPAWMQHRLLAAGMRPINNVVDVTNYVMLELGHPLHAFDMEDVKGNSVVVKKYPKAFDFVTLDEVKRSMHTEDLMICNSSDPMCIAGVFGGLKAGVNESTTAVFVESAWFNPVSVRRTSTRHALKTESSFRFERGADPSMTIPALMRTAELLCQVAGAKVSSPVYDVYPQQAQKKHISLTHSYVDASIGHHISPKVQINILKDLDFEIIEQSDDSFVVAAPFAKVDVTRPADVVEEILRIYGYNNIPFPDGMRASLSQLPRPDAHLIQNIFSEMLVGKGFFEMMTNSLSSSEYYNSETGFEEKDTVNLLNPLSSELNAMRRTLLFNGLESVAYNINRKQQDLRFFEFGKTYRKTGESKEAKVENQFFEEKRLVLYMTGNVFPLNWKYSQEETAFVHLKDIVSVVLKRAGIDESMVKVEETNLPVFAYGLKFSLKKSGESIVEFGSVSKKILDLTACRQQVMYADFAWETIIKQIGETVVKAIEPSKYPEVRRDIAMLLDEEVNYNAVREVIDEHGHGKIIDVSLFDIYVGEKIPKGKKSYAVSIILQDSTKTLTDQETDSILNAIREALIKKLGAVIR